VEYLLRDVATLLALPYYKIYYAHYSGQVPEPRKVGRTRIYTDADLERLRRHFAQRNNKGNSAIRSERPVTKQQ
jgi:DNA-binding transcriptional MerR regulator